MACAAVAQGELGQARVLYPLLQELGFGGPVDLGPAVPRLSGVGARPAVPDLAPTVSRCCWSTPPSPSSWRPWPAAATPSWPGGRRACWRRRRSTGLRRGPGRRRAGRPARWAPAAPGPRRRVPPRAAVLVRPAGEQGGGAGRPGILGGDNREPRGRYLDRVGPVLEDAGVELRLRRDPASGRLDDGQLPWERCIHLQRRLEPPAASIPTTW